MNKKNVVVTILSVLILMCIFAFARTTTTNLGLVKPTWDENIDILTDINANMDLIDAAFNAGAITEAMLDIDNAPTDEYVLTWEADSGKPHWQVEASAVGTVDTSGIPVANDFARFTDADTIEGRSYSETRTDLSLVIGTNVQAWDTQLDDIAALAVTDSNFIVGDGTNWIVESGATARTSLGIDLSLYYLKTEIDTQGEMETIWGVALATDTELAALTFTDLTDTPSNYTDDGSKYVRVNSGGTALEFVTKAKLDATTAPTVNNDNTEFYSVGSRWMDVTNDKEYVCLDATTGSAVWTETTATATAGLPVIDTTGVVKGSVDATKIVRFEVDGLSASTTRVLTVQDKDITIAGAGANTDITSLAHVSLKVGRDADNLIDFTTDNKIVFRFNAADKAEMISTGELDMNAGSVGFTLQTATGDGTTTIDWKLGNKFKFTFGAQNDTFTFTAPTNPCNLLLILVQDATGSRLATWPSIKWVGGTAPTLTTTANGEDIASFFYDGTSYYGVASLAFAAP